MTTKPKPSAQRRRKVKLRAFWSRRQGDLIFEGPNGPDRRLLLKAFPVEFTDELAKRGYDVTTLVFSIERRHGLSQQEGEEEDGSAEEKT